MCCIYDVKSLLDLAQDYFESEATYQIKAKQIKGRVHESSKSEYAEYSDAYGKSYGYYYGFLGACKVVGADPKKVMALAKSIRRYEDRIDWESLVEIPQKYDYIEHKYTYRQVCEYLAEDSRATQCWKSTGRWKGWFA